MRNVVIALLVSSAALASAEPCPDEVPSTGRYINESEAWPFSIVIPPGLKGFWSSPGCTREAGECICMGDHGRIIPLAPAPDDHDRYIEVFAGYNSTDARTLRELVHQHLESRTEEGQVVATATHRIRLAGRPGLRTVIHYVDSKSRLPLVNDAVIIGTDVQFTLELVTREKDYAHDRRIFEKMLRTWRPG